MHLSLLFSCDKNNDDSTTIVDPPEEPQNNAPVAVANGDQQVKIGNIAQLDGSGSNDSDGDNITYNWAFVSKPEGSITNIIGVGNELAEFTLDKAGSYEVELTVSDGDLESKDIYIITNVIPVITLVDTQTFDPSLPDNLMQKGKIVYITVNYLSPDITENKITIGDLDYEIEDFNFTDGYIAVVVPENAISGELKVTVGEQSITWSEIMYVPSFPVSSFVQANIHLTGGVRDDASYFEIGTKFKPLVNGKILGFTFNEFFIENHTVTLWDNASKIMLKQVDINLDEPINIFPEPISIEQDKEYIITVNANKWFRYIDEEDKFGNQFPKTYNNIALISTAFKGTNPGVFVFPNDEFPENYIVYGPDVIFAEDSQ